MYAGANCEVLTGKTFGVLDWRSFTGGGRLLEVVAHGGSPVHRIINGPD